MRYIRFKKLEQFCLHVIVENLEKFIYNKNIPQKHIDFLLRVYSEDVFKKFSHREQVSEDCMLWFLNPHSRKIMLTTVSEKIVSQLQIVGSTITSLSLKESLASESLINAIISCVPHVVHLNMRESLCSDKNLLCIQRMCPELVSLDLNSCEQVTDEGMKNLCGKNRSLKKLNLVGTAVESGGICVILNGMPLLEQLKCYEMAATLYKIHEKDFQTNAYRNIRYNLTEFIYEDLGMFPDVLEVIRVWTVLCPYVTTVFLGFSVTQEELFMCSRFEYLERLIIMFHSEFSNALAMHSNSVMHVDGDEEEWNEEMGYAEDILAPFLPKINRLTTLNLAEVEIPWRASMECFKNLKTLILQKVTFTEFLDDDVGLKENKLEVLVLKKICLDVSSTREAILCLLSLSINVTALYLTSMKNMPQNVWDVILSSMKNLSFVNFNFTPINLPTVLRFFQIPSLTKMCLDGCWNVSSPESPDFNRLVSPSHSSTLSWCQWNDDSDDSDDENSVPSYGYCAFLGIII